jgi:hypothetical protein
MENVHKSWLKVPLFLSDVYEIWSISTELRKILKYKIVLKSVQWQPSCSMQMDRQTDMTMVIVAFHNFAKSAWKFVIRIQLYRKYYLWSQGAACFCMFVLKIYKLNKTYKYTLSSESA